MVDGKGTRNGKKKENGEGERRRERRRGMGSRKKRERKNEGKGGMKIAKEKLEWDKRRAINAPYLGCR